MREDVSETRKILEKHEHSMTAVWLETVQVFKLRPIVRKAGFEKEPGYRVAEIITLRFSHVACTSVLYQR